MGKKKREGTKKPVPKGFPEQIHIYRRMVIVIENDTIGDRQWNKTVAESLREYANAVNQGWYGNTSPEIMETDNGNKLTILVGTYQMDCEPQKWDQANIRHPRKIIIRKWQTKERKKVMMED